jgi:hypothetical protein
MEHTSEIKAKIEPLDMNAYQQKKCKWSLSGEHKAEDPHFHPNPYYNFKFRIERKKIYNNIIEAIHWSPMVKLNNIPKSEGIKCEIGKFNLKNKLPNVNFISQEDL